MGSAIGIEHLRARTTPAIPHFRLLSPPDTTQSGSSPDTSELHYPIEEREQNFFSEEEGEYNSFDLEDPDNIDKNINYDPDNNEYQIEENIGKDYYRAPADYSFEEFLEKKYNKDEEEYWEKRARAGNLLEDESVIPELQIGNETFDQIFGGNLIEIKPTGNVKLEFGGNYQKVDNPSFTEQQKKHGGFLFDMDINANVVGNIGDKMKINFNYNTQSQFNFDNKIKLDYSGDEDQIIQKIEAGDVSFPIQNSLIKGSQKLFGIKTELQFGRLTVTSVFSQQESQTESIQIKGGAQEKEFSIQADEYDDNKHFFLAQYFRNHYNEALQDLPVINSNINIEKIEIWVTNKSGATENTRNVIGFMDLGEPNPYRSEEPKVGSGSGRLPENSANQLYQNINKDGGVRNPNTALQTLQSQYGLEPLTDFKKTYAKKLSKSEYTLHPKLGYISLNQRLSSDEVLAVAFEYTYNGEVYQVGEFSQNNPPSGKNQEVLYLKLLKSTSVRPELPIWDLMMKNIYSIDAYQVNKDGFELNVYFQDPGGGVKRYIPEGNPKGKLLLSLLNLDNLNRQLDPNPDGTFDFVRGITINPQSGEVIFPVVEPFAGDSTGGLRSAFNNQVLADKYVYDQLYDSTKVIAQQYPEFNRYSIKGTYQSSVGSEINLNRMNIPKGSVKVTAGGRELVEGVHYSVDYMLGKVKILDERILNSGQPINISFESQGLNVMQKKTMWGTRLDYWINDNFTLGGTVLHLSERPITQKVDFGREPIANTVMGLDGSYHTESQLLTRLVDGIPLIDTKEKSSITAKGEFAHLIPGHSRAIEQNDEPVTYIDDFEGSRSFYDLKLPAINWQLASTPQNATNKFGQVLFPEADSTNDLSYNKNRAKLAWYMMDPIFSRDNLSSTPKYIRNNPKIQNHHYVREIIEKEVFPQTDLDRNEPATLPTLSLAYYPNERGPYNYDHKRVKQNGKLKNPKERWAGVMQDIVTNNFEAANVEYVEIWVMDPFIYNKNHDGGDMYIQLGNVSEDILKDGKKQFENGLPTSRKSGEDIDTTAWGYIPVGQPITNSFDNDPQSRKFQDVGLDGLRDEAEQKHFQAFLDSIQGQVNPSVYQELQNDPSNDNYHYYLGEDFDSAKTHPLVRYHNYSDPHGNSPISTGSNTQYSKSATNIPTSEDLNEDNTLSETEEYFQYHLSIRPEDMKVGQNFITDKVTKKVDDFKHHPDSVTWYQFKIPIKDYQSKVGNIQDFKSIRFIRTFLTNFEDSIIMRMGRFGLVRHQWRKYSQSLLTPGEYQPSDNRTNTSFDVSVVNVEENSQRKPVPYMLPPGIQREQRQQSTSQSLVKQNEQSLSLSACNLRDGDARAAYKNIDMDLRQFKRMKMYVHAEEMINEAGWERGDIRAFIRIGSDFKSNYYEYEIPLKPTTRRSFHQNEDGSYPQEERQDVWPQDNRMNIPLDSLVHIKLKRDESGTPLNQPYSISKDSARITIVGNPDLGSAKVMMIGIRNPKATNNPGDDGMTKCAEVWFNELRLSQFNEQGGSAALGRVETQLADFGNLSLSGNMHTEGYGAIDQNVHERYRDDYMQYNATGSFQLGDFFPREIGVRIPVYASISEAVSQPKYHPYNTDVILEDQLDFIRDKYQGEEQSKRIDSIRRVAEDYTRIKSLNFSNVRIAPPKASKKSYPWDVRNFNMTYAYTETFKRDPTMDTNLTKQYRGAFGYNYSPSTQSITPFKSLLKRKWSYLRLIRDINFNPLPTSVSVNTEMNRRFNKTSLRSIGTEQISIPAHYDKQFEWGRRYNVQFNLTKSISVTYNANASSRIDEPKGKITDREIRDGYTERDSVWDNIEDFGRMKNYRHNVNASYNLPLQKLPLTNWINVSLNYGAQYSWDAASLTPSAQSRGNVINNGQTKRINTNLNTQRLYNNLDKLGQQIGGLFGGGEEEGDGQQGDKKGEDQDQDQDQGPSVFKQAFKRLITGIQGVSLNYRENRSTTVPGFMPKPSFMGADSEFSSPGWDFLFGHQPGNPVWKRGWQPDSARHWLDEARQKGWMSNDTLQNQEFMQTMSKNLNARASFQFIKGLKIDVDAKRNITRRYRENFRDTVPGERLDRFAHLNPMESGQFSMSYNMIETAFQDTDTLGRSPAFKRFKNRYRKIISQRLARQHSQNPGRQPSGYHEGYGRNAQQVLIPSFLAAYSDQPVKQSAKNPVKLGQAGLFPDIPKPNWRLTYSGLSRLPLIKKVFKSFKINHSYQSTYSIDNFETALDYETYGDEQSPRAKNNNDNFYPKYEVQQVSLSEKFSPLLGINFTLLNGVNGKFSYTKRRTVRLSMVNYQIKAIRSASIQVGAGYKIKNLDLGINLGPIGGGEARQKSLDIKVDFQYRSSENVIHKLEQNISKPTSGMTTIQFQPKADYNLSRNLTSQLFFNYRKTIPATSASYPNKQIEGGIRLRYTLRP